MTKTMVVTGSSRGIGAAIARLAAADGYRVAVNYLSDAASANAVVGDIVAAGGAAIAVQADVGVPQDVERLFDAVDRAFGRLDVLVNNAGVLGSCRVEDIDAATLERVFRANVFSMFYCSRMAVRRMSTTHGGTGGAIVNMSSVASRLGGMAGGSHYAATKGAIDSFSLALAKEVGAEGIRVNTVRPGLIETDIHDIHGGSAHVRELAKTAVPMARSGSADEVAQTVLWLASPQASYVHGAVVDVAGGR
ncbi:SDR family oxidoreductase [Alcaligenaceae bacterium C4P045]|nr:SDR family oxidoreductase [Alcaligenaceae bacterium C4P045]